MKERSHVPPYKGYKSKWIAGVLSCVIPGTGYFYLGLMFKGVAVMFLMALDIAAIAYAAIELNNPLLIILLSLLLPIVYFYNLFDAIQSTDMVNARQEKYFQWTGEQFRSHEGAYGVPPYSQEPVQDMGQGPSRGVFPAQSNVAGLVVLALAVVLILIAASIGSSSWVFRTAGTRAGAVIFIVTGIGLWLWDSRRRRSGNS